MAASISISTPAIRRQPRSLRRAPRGIHACQRVMIRQRQGVEPQGQRELDEPLRRAGAVGRRGVRVEIYHLTSL